MCKEMRPNNTYQEIQSTPVKEPPVDETRVRKSDEARDVNDCAAPTTNLDKIYWPQEKITKYQLIDYYLNIAEVILPYLKDRPQNLHRYPEGIHKDSFYQKDTAGIFPHWVDTVNVYSKSNDRDIEYMLCQ